MHLHYSLVVTDMTGVESPLRDYHSSAVMQHDLTVVLINT